MMETAQTPSNTETLAQRAAAGESKALNSLLERIADDVYGIALRMLWHPADAEDATQEILLRVATKIHLFAGRSTFRTWAYRLAVRAILNFRRGRAEAPISFEEFGADLQDGLRSPPPSALSPSELRVLRQEVRLACTHAMLLCLDRPHRVAYLVGEILGLSGPDAAACLEVDGPTYRKRLSRARQRVHDFTAAQCGIVDEAAPCRCAHRVGAAIQKRRIDPSELLFVEHPVHDADRSSVEALEGALHAICDAPSLMRATPHYQAPKALLESLSTQPPKA